MKKKVAIIGGGCTGWWLACELAKAGISCIIIDTDPVGAYASTGNQGWLHGGAYYALQEEHSPTAEVCKRGYHFIQCFYPEAVREKFPCYFLLTLKGQMEEVLRSCSEQDIFARQVDIEKVKGSEPLLQDTPFTYAVEVLDRCFDSSLLLSMIVKQAHEHGVRFRSVEKLQDVGPQWDAARNRWKLFPGTGKDEIECSALVLACGAFIPKMLEQLNLEEGPSFKITKTAVLVLRGEISRSLLITPLTPGGPNLVPFFGSEGSGATVTLRHVDEKIPNAEDTNLPADSLPKHVNALSDIYPALTTMISQGRIIDAHFYTCQKLEIDDGNPFNRTPILLDFAPQPDTPRNVFAVYPGKFTAAPVIAIQCASRIKKLFHNPGSSATLKEATVARRKYYDVAEYRLVLKNGLLEFDPL